jgi:hypothetical protein
VGDKTNEELRFEDDESPLDFWDSWEPQKTVVIEAGGSMLETDNFLGHAMI